MFARINIYTIVLAFTILLVAAIGITWFMRAKSYEYDVRKDYHYDFIESDAKITYTRLFRGILYITKNDTNDRQSTFVKVDLRSRLSGRFFQPRIRLSSVENSLDQYFEHGAKGIRYINISQLLSAGVDRIELKGKHIKVRDNVVQLIRFHNDSFSDKKILVISPHPDDAEIAAYGFYSSYNNAYVVTVTAGDAGEVLYGELFKDSVQHFLEKGRIRTWNSLTVPLLAGIAPENILNMGYFDGTLMEMVRDETADIPGVHTGITDINYFRQQNTSLIASGLSGGSNWRSFIDNFKFLLRATEPDIIVTTLPVLDYNNDHKYTTLALILAMKELNIREGKLYLYTNGSDISRFYPLGEMGSIVSLPPNFDREFFCRKLYSHPLTPQMQDSKVLALDAMNDLRGNTEWRFWDESLKRAIRIRAKELFHRDETYFRRSVRSNELFFVVDAKDIYNDHRLSLLLGE